VRLSLSLSNLMLFCAASKIFALRFAAGKVPLAPTLKIEQVSTLCAAIFVFSPLTRANALVEGRKQKIPPAKSGGDLFCFSTWCLQESNQGHKDFQSFALPTELRHPANFHWKSERACAQGPRYLVTCEKQGCKNTYFSQF
jgi:hypothetical protein